MAHKLQFFVAGLGRFGKSVAITLEKMGYDVMAMDSDEEVVQDLSDTLGYVGLGNIMARIHYYYEIFRLYRNRNSRFNINYYTSNSIFEKQRYLFFNHGRL